MKTKINSPKVSVIIPTYLRSTFLSEAIESVLSQTLKEFEVIVVNDSDIEDETIKVLNKFSDKRIKYYKNTRKKGANGARNTGILKSKGKYIAMLDDDDIMNSAKLEKQYIFLEENPQFGLVSTQVDVIDEKGESFRVIDDQFTPEDIFFNLIFKNCIVHSSVMMRRDIIKEAGYYNEGLAYTQDYELWCRMIRISCFAQINKKLLRWREHGASITGKKRQYQKLADVRLAIKNIKKISDRMVSEEKMIEVQDKNERGISDLRESVLLFRNVYRAILKNESLETRGCTYNSELLKKAMNKKTEISLYCFFSKRSPYCFFSDFLYLPITAKWILLKKINKRLVKIPSKLSVSESDRHE